MTTSKNRIIASLISNDTSKIKEAFTDSDNIVSSASLGVVAASGTAVYSSADTLPATANNGDQALVSSTNRLYIYTGGGWYNIALINNSPFFTTSPSSSYQVSNTGAQTNIEILAFDSEGINLVYTATTDSNFDDAFSITKDSDNGRKFTVSLDSDQTASATGTVTFKASDGVNIVSAVSTFSVTFTVTNAFYSSLLLKADTGSNDNQVDSSSNSYTITESGNVTSTAYTPYHPGGYSAYFDAVDDYLEVSANAGFGFGTGDFTIEMWIYLNSFTSGSPGYSCLVDLRTGVTATATAISALSTGQLTYYDGPANTSYNGGSISLNTWHHVALTRESGVWKSFVDGTQAATHTNASDLGSSQPVRIGVGQNGFGTNPTNGYIRDFRIVKGTAVYTSNFTPPTSPLTAITNTSLLCCHLPYHSDGSANDHTITVYSDTPLTRIGPYDYLAYNKTDYGGSVYFDGSGDYFTAGGNSDSGLSGTFTIEFWMYLTTAYTVASQTLVSNYDGGATNWYIQQRNNGSLWLGASIGTPLTYNLSPKTNQWYHIAFSNNSSSSTGKLFVNGKEVDDHTGDLYNSTHMAAAAYPITVGRLGNNTTSDFTGYIADLRIIDGTMLYTTNFTPPTSPLTAVTNTKLLTCTNKNDVWDEISGALVTKAGNAAASNTQRKFTSSSAMYFDGTGDYITAAYNKGFDLPGDFTIEAWIYASSLSGNNLIVDTYEAGVNGSFQLYHRGTGDSLAFYVTGDNVILQDPSSSTITTGNWYHVAVTRSGTTCKMFIDGTEIDSATNSRDLSHSNNVVIGRQDTSGTNYWNGYIQDVRITKGLARYTTNFTPPTAEFDG